MIPSVLRVASPIFSTPWGKAVLKCPRSRDHDYSQTGRLRAFNDVDPRGIFCTFALEPHYVVPGTLNCYDIIRSMSEAVLYSVPVRSVRLRFYREVETSYSAPTNEAEQVRPKV